MKKQPKYKIFDEVWLMRENEILKSSIYGISILGKTFKYELKIDKIFVTTFEKLLFPTKKDLINSL